MAERRIVTVLFADVVGFTSLAEGLDPEDLATVQDGYFAAVRETLENYGGRLEKFIGDAAVAVFGTPRARRDDAERAVRGGLALHAAVASLAARLGLPAGALRIRVGVNTGEVAYTPDEDRITGDVVNVAARLQSVAPPGGVVVGPDTALAVADRFELEAVGGLDLKGKDEAVRGSVIAGVRPVPSRDLALGSMSAATVGRREETERLLAAAATIDAGPRWQLIVAPPGVGKSRLVRELVRRLRGGDEHVRVLRARCQEEAAHPYEPIAELVSEALRGSGIDVSHVDVDAAAAVLRERLGGAATDGLDHLVAEVVSLLEGRVDGSDTERSVRFGAWLSVLRVLEDGVPSVWIVEDLHDASADVIAFLEHASASTLADRRLVVATARPEVTSHRPWSGDGAAENGDVLHLEPLAGADVRTLLSELTRGALPDRVADDIVDQAGGNPLFVEELLRTWLLLGVLRETADGLELAAAPEELVVPTTVQTLYAAQLDDMPEAARSAAQRGAVLGQTFPLPGLRALAPDIAEAGLATLRERALLDGPLEDPLGAAYRYRHALLRDTAYRTLSRSDRAALHVAAAAWLEDLDVSTEVRADLLAYHYGAAVEQAPKLLDAIGPLPRDTVFERARTWRLRAARAALRAGALDAARRHAEVLLELTAEAEGAELERAEAEEIVGAGAANVDLELGAEWLHRALASFAGVLAAAADGDVRERAAHGHVRAAQRLARLRFDQVRFDAAAEVAEASVELVADVLPAAATLGLRAQQLRAVGAMTDAGAPGFAQSVEALVREAREAGDDEALFAAEGVRLEYADTPLELWPTAAEAQSRRAEALGRWADVVALRRMVGALITPTSTARGLEMARTVPGLARSLGLAEAEAFATYGVVEAGLASGDWDEAEQAAHLAWELAERHRATRALVRTTFALLPIAEARDRDDVRERIGVLHDEMRPTHPDLSPYARVMLTAVRWTAGRPPRPGDEPSPADLAQQWQGTPSGLCAIETGLRAWLAAGRIEAAADAVDLGRGPIAEFTAMHLNVASWELARSWLALAGGDTEEAVAAARRSLEAADGCGAPWWAVRAIRCLEEAGVADAALMERRIRTEIALGVERPQAALVTNG